MVDRFAVNWRTAGFEVAFEALLAFVEKLTVQPARCGAGDVAALRGFGWSDRAITDAVQVCAYFNYINRIADGLGIDLEDWIDERGRVLDHGTGPVA